MKKKNSSKDRRATHPYILDEFEKPDKIKSLPLIPKEDWNKFRAMSLNKRVKYVEKLKES